MDGRCKRHPILIVLLGVVLTGYGPGAFAGLHPCMKAAQPEEHLAHHVATEVPEVGADHDCCEHMSNESPGSSGNSGDAPTCMTMCPSNAACKSGSSTISVRAVGRVPDPDVLFDVIVPGAESHLPAMQPADVWHPPRFI